MIMKEILKTRGRTTSAAMAGCLAVLIGWGGAVAQGFQAVAGGYDATHSTGSDLGQWEARGSRGAWSVVTAGGRTGAAAADNVNGETFLILRTSAFTCSNDGTYTVTFNAGEFDWALHGAAIVFRHSSSGFYALRVRHNNGNNYHPILFSKGVLHDGDQQSGEEALGSAFTLAAGQNITLTVELAGSRITVLRNGTQIADFTDDTYPSGQVGYAQANMWQRSAVFMSSSWRNKEKSVPDGYLAWNTVAGMDFTPGTGGNWLGGNTWSPQTSATAPAAWISGRSAYFNSGVATGTFNIAANGAVTADTLRFENSGFRITGATGTSSVALSSGRIIAPSDVSANIDAVLAGTSGLTLSGGGTLTLGGGSANTYTGATSIIGAGTIVAAKTGALGTGAVNITGVGQLLQLSNATLNNTGTITIGSNNMAVRGASGTPANSISGPVALSGTGAVIIEVAQPLTMSGVISGAGLAKTGAATMTLTGANTYTGATEVREGTLQIGATGTGNAGGATGSLAGSLNISAGATAVFSRSSAVTQNGVSGAGSLVKRGTGTLTLSGTNNTGANAHTGTTTIENGAIQITGAANLGSGTLSVLPAGRLILNAASGTASFARAMNIAGTFEKSGGGAINLTTALTAGTVDVSGGSLNVELSGTDALSADSVVVRGNARLTGTGTVGKSGARIVVNNGTLAGKNYSGNVTLGSGGVIEQATPGLLQVTGNLTMNAGSRLDIALTSGMRTSSTIQATGALALGGTLNITSPITDADTGTYRVMTGMGSVTGSFSAITIAGQAADVQGYLVSSSVAAGGVVTVNIRKIWNDGIVRNPLNVVRAVLFSDSETSSVFDVTVSGFDSLAGYLSGSNPGVTAIHIWYKPGSRVVTGTDTTAVGGRETVLTPAPAITGNEHTFRVTINAPGSARDTLFFFNVSVDWRVENEISILTPSQVPVSAYARDPKNAVAPNGFAIMVGDYTNTAAGMTFPLTVTGQNSPQLTPMAEYKPHVDMVAVWIKRNGSLPSLNGNALTAAAAGADSVMIIPLSQLRENDALTVNMARVQNERADTIYFAIAPHWTGAGIDSIARPLYTVNTVVVNPTLPMPNNPVTLSAVQADPREREVVITLGIMEPFNEHARQVVVELSFEASMVNLIEGRERVFDIGEVAAGHTYTVLDDGFAGEERTVFYRITVTDSEGLGIQKPGSFTVGRKPPNPLVISVERLGRGAMMLRWNPVTVTGNNVGDVAASTVTVAYDASMISRDDNIAAHPSALTVPASNGEVRLPPTGELTPETDYWFAAVLNDIVDPAKPSWNLSSEPAIVMENTGPYHYVSNIIRIDTIIFREATADFEVVFGLLFDNTDMVPYRYVYDITLGSDTLVRTGEPAALRIFFESSRDTVITASLGEALMFDTTYRIHMYTVGEDGNVAPGRAMRDVGVGAFKSQTVHITSGGTGFVNNRKFGITAPQWDMVGVSPPTHVRRVDDVPNVDGLIYLGDYGYRYRVDDDRVNALSPRFTIHMAAEEVPPPYEIEDVRMYRWTGSFWEVLYDTRYEDGYFTATAGTAIPDDTTSTYRLLISTSKPAVMRHGIMLTGGSAHLPVVTNINVGIEEDFLITSTIGNFEAKLLVAPADNTTLSPASEVNNPAYSRARTFRFVIDPKTVGDSEQFGILAFLIVNDGRNADTINVSRRVVASESRASLQGVNVQASKWLPFASQVDLDNKNVKNALSQFFTEGEDFAMYDTLFRLFRWFPNADNARSDRKWVEYDGSNDNDFSMEPGRLMWIKTANAQGYQTIKYGSATSVSLVDTFAVKLPPKQWTDFVLPFRYSIHAGDVLGATDADMELYRWAAQDRGRHSYITEKLALLVDPADSLRILDGYNDAFTVFNPGDDTIYLKIPPRPASLSRYSRSALAKSVAGSQSGSGIWYYTINAGTANSPALNDVMVGYNVKKRAFAVPPSFSNESVVLLDANGMEMGHYFGPELTRGGTFTLRFYNDEKQRATFKFNARQTGFVPADMQVSFVSAVTGKELAMGEEGYSVAVAGQSYQDVYMIVGSADFRDKIGAGAPDVKFSVGAVIVNQAARSVRLKYYIPFAGIDRVEASVYDIRGRRLWKNTDRVRASSWNTMEWRSRDSRHGAAAGMYIIRVRAIDARGRTVAVENRRITFAR